MVCSNDILLSPLHVCYLADIDECGQTSTCSQLCKNSIGGYECGCLSGFTLSGDGQSCFKNSTPGMTLY